MNNISKSQNRMDSMHTSALAFWMIRLMHDNPLLPCIKNPYKLLEAAGLKAGQTVMEVGCGPGFFTIPAAAIVGQKGLVYATDVNPLAIKYLKDKLRRRKITNVVPVLVGSSTVSAAGNSIDLAFIFGLRHVSGGRDNLLREMHRILVPAGILVYENTTGDRSLTADAEIAGFSLNNVNGRIYRLIKS